ncbi:ABC transporter G family member 20-like protein [Dinothrombium tinctorium]|uniref:ABC transporter G family member 20-like protein n=1 Tax=Dinothrombium tinctorium TaxID=1965070 RepID=A0A3S3RYC5_9ACAR|nr:ABC transporter G family member 20-like protein [Dinothrombium tinctorium]
MIAQFILPLISLLLFCFCVGRTPIEVPLAVVNEENPPYLSEIYINNINKQIIKVTPFQNLTLALEAVKQTEVWGLLHIRQNFSDSLIHRTQHNDESFDNETLRNGTMLVYADLSNKILSVTLQRALHEAVESFIVDSLYELNYSPQLFDLPIKVEQSIYGSYSKGDYFALRDFSIPGVLIILSYTIAFGLTVMLLTIEKNDQMFERNFVAGVSSTQIIIAHLAARVVFMSINVALLLIVSLLFFNVPTRGPIVWAILLLFLQSVTGLTHGMMVSAICTNVFMAAILSNGILLFIFIVSGVLWSIESMPHWLRWLSYLQPTTIPTESLRCVLSRGMDITHFSVFSGYIVTIAYIITFFFISVILFRNEKND